jgi:uncharacterized protein
VALVVDSGFVLALARARDDDHEAARAWMQTADEDLVTSPLALAEMDYLIGEYLGTRGQQALWSDLAEGVYSVRWWADAIGEVVAVARRHPWIGLSDSSLVALAGRLRTNRILTFDDHFRSLTMPGGEPFVLLPGDA